MYNKEILNLLFGSSRNELVKPDKIIKSIKVYISDDLNISLSMISGILRHQEIFVNIFNLVCYGMNLPKLEFSAYHTYSTVGSKFKYGNVLIYVPELELYQLFDDLEKYKAYLKRMQDNEVDLEFCQLVLISAEHKFILRCENNPELISKIENILGSNTEITEFSSYVQLTFGSIKVSSFIQEQALFEKITRDILDGSIHVPRHGCDSRFVENKFNCEDRSVTEILENIERYVMQIGNSNIICSIGDITNSTVNINMTNTRPDNNTILEQWLIDNPINGRVLQDNYRQKFLNDTGIMMTNNTFGKSAKKYIQGYTNNGKGYYKPQIKK